MARMKIPRLHQRTFELLQWGGARSGAGRKKQKGAGVSHKKRAEFPGRFPVHVTARIVRGLGSLRRRSELRALQMAFRAGCEKDGFRLVHYSVQTNHLHLLVEAQDRKCLARGLQGLFVRMARALNRLWRRLGKVFADRYHDRILHTPRQVRNALAYVLCNARKHGVHLAQDRPDPCTSGAWFDGWLERSAVAIDTRHASAIAHPRTWLLKVGWLRHGRLSLAEIPCRA